MLNKIVLDPGHCARWAGASGKVLRVLEHVIVLNIALMMRKYFESQGVHAIMTHETDECLNRGSKVLDLSARFNFAYSRRLPIFSLHCNSAADPKAYGYECYTLPGQDQSDAWATSLLYHYKQAFPKQRIRADLRDGDPDKEANLAVLRHRTPNGELRNTGVLFELPFLSNPAEEAWLADQGNYPKIARVLCDGTIAWLRKYT